MWLLKVQPPCDYVTAQRRNIELVDKLQQLNLKSVNVIGDRNCLFRAVSY